MSRPPPTLGLPLCKRARPGAAPSVLWDRLTLFPRPGPRDHVSAAQRIPTAAPPCTAASQPESSWELFLQPRAGKGAWTERSPQTPPLPTELRLQPWPRLRRGPASPVAPGRAAPPPNTRRSGLCSPNAPSSRAEAETARARRLEGSRLCAAAGAAGSAAQASLCSGTPALGRGSRMSPPLPFLEAHAHAVS